MPQLRTSPTKSTLTRSRTTNPTLPSPDRTPEPSASVRRRVRDLDPQLAPERGIAGRTSSGFASKGRSTSQSTASVKWSEQSQSTHSADDVPVDLARTVVNMQQHYAEELGAVSGEVHDLRREARELRVQSKEMRRRLDLHLELLKGAVDFIQHVKEGRFSVGAERAVGESEPEMRLARALGVEHTDRVEGLGIQTTEPVESWKTPLCIRSTSDVAISQVPDVESAIDAEVKVKTESPLRISIPPIFPEEPIYADAPGSPPHNPKRLSVNMNEPPPTPLQSGHPIRSTGRGVPKRKHPWTPATLTRQPKRKRSRKQVYSDEELDEAVADLEYCPVSRGLRFREFDAGGEEDLVSRAGEQGAKGMVDPGMRLRPRRSTAWTAVNAPAGQETRVLRDDDAGSDYEPGSEPEDDDDHHHHEHLSCHTPSPQASNASTPAIFPGSDLPDLPRPTGKKPRYSTARQTIPRYAAGPPNKPFQYQRMGRSVADVWQEYKHGANGNPPIEIMEERYGTGWRSGTLRDIKYGSNYVGVRKMVVRKVEDMCEKEEGLRPEEACKRLDERVDGRLQLLINAVRHDRDPFEVVPPR